VLHASVGPQGPNASARIYYQTATLAVKRTPGLVVFEISYQRATVSISIDGICAYTACGDFQFDSVHTPQDHIGDSNKLAYFDKYEFEPFDADEVSPPGSPSPARPKRSSRD
jgi:hypothetical protein